MRAGDLLSLYDSDFRIAIAVDSQNLVIIYRLNKVDIESMNSLLDHIDNHSNYIATEPLPQSNYEIYKTNIFSASKVYGKSINELFKYIYINLKKIHTFSEGDILKMEGLKLMNLAIYHHHAIFSGIHTFLLLTLLYNLY